MFIDLLFFNREPNSLVVVELKSGKFRISHLGIYSRAYAGNLYFYKYPGNKKVVNYILQEYNPEMYPVIDCRGNWLKVESEINGIWYVGWIEPIMQCCNIYSTCN